MSSDREIEQFIATSFTSIWDIELLAQLLEGNEPLEAEILIERMRASELVVQQGVTVLVAAGIATLDESGRIAFTPVNADVERLARQACEFYRRFPNRARQIMIARQAPGLTAFANAFRLRKE